MARLNGTSLAQLAKDENISAATLYNWRKAARAEGRLLPDQDQSPEGWSSEDKFNAVLETAPLSQHETSEYCRRKGLYPEQLARWRQACCKANATATAQSHQNASAARSERKTILSLQRQLQRKEKALAEAAALLILRKKAEAIWGEEDV
jgi:transposase-like protein